MSLFEVVFRAAARSREALGKALILSDEGMSNDAQVRQSALRIVLFCVVAVLTIVWLCAMTDMAAKVSVGHRWVISGFLTLACLAFAVTRARPCLASLILIGSFYAAALLIGFGSDDLGVRRLGLLFCYAVPLLAGVLLSFRLAVLLTALNLVPFSALVDSYFAPATGTGQGPVETPFHVNVVFYVVFNLALPAAAFRLWHGTRSAIRQLRTSVTTYEDLFEHSGAASLVCDSSGVILRANTVFMNLRRPARRDICGKRLASVLMPTDQRGAATLQSGRLSRGGEWLLPVGTGVPKRLLVRSLVETGKGALAINFLDVTELRRVQANLHESEARARYLALHDAMTGLPNRARLLGRIAERTRDPEPEGVMPLLAIRLNVLRQANSRHGNAEGDKLIARFGRELVRAAGEGFVVRLHGVVFGIALDPEHSPEAALAAVERLFDALPKRLRIGDEMIDVAVSAGLVFHPGDGDQAADLVRHAELALDAARREKLRLACFDRDIAKRAGRRLAIEMALATALDDGEFSVVYQPKVSSNGRLLGFEALLRWDSVHLGQVPPAEFVPISEDTGIVTRLTDFALETVCTQIEAWRKRGLNPPPVAVNLSELDLERSDLVELILAAAARHNLPAGAVELEITETFLGKQSEQTINLLQRLRDWSFSIAIDDFGTGYSSLSKLAELPLSVLKIDRAFLQDLSSDPKRGRVVRSIMMLARSLELEIVAEGVESAAQLAFLKVLGVEVFQGFFFHAPAPAAHWDGLIASRGPSSNGIQSPAP